MQHKSQNKNDTPTYKRKLEPYQKRVKIPKNNLARCIDVFDDIDDRS